MDMNERIIPNISRKAFWDIDFDKLDFEARSGFIMDKVFNYGSFSDQVEIIRFYGVDRIKEEIVKIPYFRKPVFAFLSGFFKIDKSCFIAYNRRQQHPDLWEY